MLQTIFLQMGNAGTQMMLMFGVFIAFMFFTMILPQMRKQKAEKKFQEMLKVGTRVVLTSGLHGKIAQIMDDGVVIETTAGKLKFEKAAISREYTQARFPETAAKADKK